MESKVGIKCIVGDGAHASIARVENGVPYLSSKNFKQEGIDLSILSFISRKDFEKHFKESSKALTKPRSKDLILSIIGSIGAPYLVRETDEFGISSSVALIRTLDEVLPEYLYYYLKTSAVQNYVEAIKSGSAQGFLSLEMIKSIPLNYPSIPTQRRIASILSAYDDLIEVNNQRIKLLEETARELYKEWFVRMRFPGHKEAKFVKGVPKGWEVTTIADEVNIKMGQSPKSEFYNEVGEGLPFHQGVGTYGLRFPEHKIFCSVTGRIAEKGDILFSVRAPVGRLNIADKKLIIGRGLSAMKHKKGLNNYLYYLLQNEFSSEDLIGNGSIFNSVGKDELKGFKIFEVGSLAKKFNDWVKPIDDQLLVLIQQNTQLRQIRDRLLPRLISGKLEVK